MEDACWLARWQRAEVAFEVSLVSLTGLLEHLVSLADCGRLPEETRFLEQAIEQILHGETSL